MGSNVDANAVTRAVRDMFKDTTDILPSAEVIIEEVGKFYNIDDTALRGQGRTKETSLARQIAMYLIRNMTKLSLKEIGKEFNNRDRVKASYTVEAALICPLLCFILCGIMIVTLGLYKQVEEFCIKQQENVESIAEATKWIRIEAIVEYLIQEAEK